MTDTPKIASQKRCDGPKKSAIRASAGVKKISVKIPQHAADSGRQKTQLQSARGFAFLRHQMPVQHRRDVGGRAGDLSKIALTAPPATVEV